MIEYKPENPFFHWNLPDTIPSSHWMQLIRTIPYEEMIKFYKNNPAVFHVIQSGIKEC